MAWARKLPSGKYAAKYRGTDGKERTAAGGPFAHKKAAERAAAEAEAKSRRMSWRSPDRGNVPWGQWCETWWPTRQVEASTLRTDQGRRDLHLMPRWADAPVGTITRHDILTWAAELAAGRDGRRRAATTVEHIVALFRASLTAAVHAGLIEHNPADRLKLGGGQATHERFLTREEYATIREHLPERGPWRLMADLLVGTGMRWGEAVVLHHHRVARDRGMVGVLESWSGDEGTAGAVKAYPKGRRPRWVPLPAWVDLPDPPTGQGGCGLVHVGAKCRGPLVITTADGGPVTLSQFWWQWKKATRAAGVGHVRVHDLRHTYASWLLQAGVPLAEVGRLLGHVSAATTQRYAHLAETPTAAVLAALGDPRRAADMQQTPTQSGQSAANEAKPGEWVGSRFGQQAGG